MATSAGSVRVAPVPASTVQGALPRYGREKLQMHCSLCQPSCCVPAPHRPWQQQALGFSYSWLGLLEELKGFFCPKPLSLQSQV